QVMPAEAYRSSVYNRRDLLQSPALAHNHGTWAVWSPAWPAGDCTTRGGAVIDLRRVVSGSRRQIDRLSDGKHFALEAVPGHDGGYIYLTFRAKLESEQRIPRLNSVACPAIWLRAAIRRAGFRDRWRFHYQIIRQI